MATLKGQHIWQGQPGHRPTRQRGVFHGSWHADEGRGAVKQGFCERFAKSAIATLISLSAKIWLDIGVGGVCSVSVGVAFPFDLRDNHCRRSGCGEQSRRNSQLHYVPPRPLEETEADIKAVEKEIVEMLRELAG